MGRSELVITLAAYPGRCPLFPKGHQPRELARGWGRRNEGGRCLESPSRWLSLLFSLQILVKTMIRKRSFGNPFEGSRREERALSAPGNLT